MGLVDFREAAKLVAEGTRSLREPDAKLVSLCGAILVKMGWNRETAGDEDFDAAKRAYAKAAVNDRIGLFVWGGFGCGKTSLLKAISSRSPRMMLWIDLCNAESVDQLDVRQWPRWNGEAMKYDVVLDDLGAEATLSDYGIRRELAGEFIVRYHLAGRGRLFVTTNLNGEELEARYTMRVCSRLKELTIPLHLKGADKRRWSAARKEEA